MAFSKINPGGWSFGDVLTSAQMNQLDADHANALDKSAAGDQIHGAVYIPSGGAVISNNVAGIQSIVAGGIYTAVPGGLTIGGGATDWPTFSVARTRTVRFPMVPLQAFNTGWQLGNPGILGPGTSAIQNLELPTHDGATIASVTVYFSVTVAHAGLGFTLPNFSVWQYDASTATATLLGSGSPPAPASASAWLDGGAVQSWTVNVNAPIARASSFIYGSLIDEFGTNAQALDNYLGLSVAFKSIPDMRFQ